MNLKSILYSGCFLDERDWQGNERIDRMVRFCDYYLDYKEELGFENISLIDNGSSKENQNKFFERLKYPDKIMFKSLENLKINHESPNLYPYCWRALYLVENLIKEGYEKIIMIDSDGFILSKNLAHYIRDLSSGWVSFLCKKYQFAESSIWILCKDSFDIFFDFIKIPYEKRMGNLMEHILPFTKVEEKFNCDRFGEEFLPINSNMDYYGQALINLSLNMI